MSDDAVFCSKCGCKFIEPEETDEIIKDTADKTEISSKTELYPEEYPTEEENTDMQLQNDLSARYSVEQNDINDNVPPLLKELSLMYEKIAKYSLATGIVEFLGAAPQQLGEDSLLEITIKSADGYTTKTNIRITAEDLELVEQLKSLTGQTDKSDE